MVGCLLIVPNFYGIKILVVMAANPAESAKAKTICPS